VAAVRRHRERGADLHRAVGGARLHAGDAPRVLDQAGCLRLHHQAESRQPAPVLREEIEKFPLRHESDEFALHRQVGEIGHHDRAAADLALDARELLVRPLQELLEQAQLVHYFERRRVHGIAAKIAQEVGVLLEHDGVDARAREEQPEHHPGGTAAGDAATGAQRRHCGAATTPSANRASMRAAA
jgi:hypothetical protein